MACSPSSSHEDRSPLCEMEDLASALQIASEDDQADLQAEGSADNADMALWTDEKQDIEDCGPWEGQTNDLGQWLEDDSGKGCWVGESGSCMQEKDDSELGGRCADRDSLDRVLETIKVADAKP
jgi:hypothetical protein